MISLPAADEVEAPFLPVCPVVPSQPPSDSSEGTSKLPESVENDESMETGSSGSPAIDSTIVMTTASAMTQTPTVPSTDILASKQLVLNEPVSSEQPFLPVLDTLTTIVSTVAQQAHTVSFTDILSSKLLLSNQSVICQQPFSSPIDTLTTTHSVTASPSPLIASVSSSPTVQPIPNSARPSPPSATTSVRSSIPNSAHSTPSETSRPSPDLSTPSKSPLVTTGDGLPPTLKFLIEAHHFLGRFVILCCKYNYLVAVMHSCTVRGIHVGTRELEPP